MFEYLAQTEVNRVFKLSEVFKMIGASKEIKQDASVIESVKLSNILSSETTNFDTSENFKEIYIVDIVVKNKILPKLFLNSFDKNINFHTLFRVFYKNEILYYSSLKSISDDKTKILKSFESSWSTQEIVPLPQVSKLEDVFKEMISFITNIKFKSAEPIQDYISRLEAIKKLKTEIEKQTKIRDSEKQPNIKMALNDKIKKLKRELQEMEG